MAKTNIILKNKSFPFVKTDKGAALLSQLSVDMDAVSFGKKEALKKYAYCMCAGASITGKIEFPFTFEQFSKVCPSGWEKQTISLVQSKEKSDGK